MNWSIFNDPSINLKTINQLTISAIFTRKNTKYRTAYQFVESKQLQESSVQISKHASYYEIHYDRYQTHKYVQYFEGHFLVFCFHDQILNISKLAILPIKYSYK